MAYIYPNGTSSQDERPSALELGPRPEAEKMTRDECQGVLDAGRELAEHAGGSWLLISGKFTSDNNKKGTEGHLRQMLLGALGYPPLKEGAPGSTLNVVLDSPGGDLDSAYTSALYLAAYSKDVRVFVPDRAKSASTLLALGADTIYLSAFGQLGPLDAQIVDPRNAGHRLSALECYQSLEYVRSFAIETVKTLMPDLTALAQKKIPDTDLLRVANEYTQSIIGPMMQNISALDFGWWGRVLRIGERYAISLLRVHADDSDDKRAADIARKLVFDYANHLYPIDYKEACRLGLRPVEMMDDKLYGKAMAVIDKCNHKEFVGWLSKDEAEKVPPWYRGIKDGESEIADSGWHSHVDHAQAIRIPE